MTVPFPRVEAFHDNHSMIDSFQRNFAQTKPASDCDLKDVSRVVMKAVADVQEVLTRRGAAMTSLPNWDEWSVEVFDHAATLIDRRTNASRNVAARYLAMQRQRRE